MRQAAAGPAAGQDDQDAALRELAQSSHVFCTDVISMVQASAVHIDSEHLDHAYSSFLIMSIILLKAAEEDGQSAETVKKNRMRGFSRCG